MGFFDDALNAVEGTYKVAQAFTKGYVQATVQDKLETAALIAAAQIATMLAFLTLGWLNDWALWSRVLISLAFSLLAAFNVGKLLFKDIPEALGFLNSWKKTWLDLMGVNLFAIILVENAGLILFWLLLIGSRVLLNWNVDLLEPWAELFGSGPDPGQMESGTSSTQ
jgi:hypothetical protein